MHKPLTIASVTESLEHLLTERGTEYVYSAPNDGECLYFDEGAPSCAVGFVLAEHGYTEEDNLDGWTDHSSAPRAPQFRTLVEEGAVEVAAPGLKAILRAVQQRQDRGEWYGDIIPDALDELATLTD